MPKNNTLCWATAELHLSQRLRLWDRPGIVLGTGERIYKGKLRLLGDQRELSLAVACNIPPGKQVIVGEALLQEDQLIAFATKDDAPLFFRLDRAGAVQESLRAEWKLGLFLFGPVLGVFLVNLIFGMPSYLWLTAAGVFVLSIGVMMSLVQKDIKKLEDLIGSYNEQ